MWTSGAGIGLSTVFLNDSGEVDHWPIKAELQTLINLGQETISLSSPDGVIGFSKIAHPRPSLKNGSGRCRKKFSYDLQRIPLSPSVASSTKCLFCSVVQKYSSRLRIRGLANLRLLVGS